MPPYWDQQENKRLLRLKHYVQEATQPRSNSFFAKFLTILIVIVLLFSLPIAAVYENTLGLCSIALTGLALLIIYYRRRRRPSASDIIDELIAENVISTSKAAELLKELSNNR